MEPDYRYLEKISKMNAIATAIVLEEYGLKMTKSAIKTIQEAMLQDLLIPGNIEEIEAKFDELINS